MSTIIFVYDAYKWCTFKVRLSWVMYAMVLQNFYLECRLTFNLNQCDSPKVFAESNINFRYNTLALAKFGAFDHV